jgi:uncharacterized protein DUF5758/pentapeptide repeat protein
MEVPVVKILNRWTSDLIKEVDAATLEKANLGGADLYGANLGGADLGGANLGGADLGGADLGGANLRSANLGGANLYGANLGGADLGGANLGGANLRSANLRSANLKAAKLPDFQLIPEEGSFIGWKKVSGGHVLRLEILEDAKRTSSLVGRKCRASAVRVLEVVTSKNKDVGILQSIRDPTFTYRKGEVSTVENFNGDVSVECTSGIHFFVTRKEAEEFDL